MLYKVEDTDVEAFQQTAAKAGTQFKEVVLSNIILIGDQLVLSRNPIQYYYDSFNIKLFKAWQTVEDNPHFYTTLNTQRKRGDLATKHRVGYSTTAVFGHRTVKIIIVEIAGAKLQSIDSSLYHGIFTQFLLEHDEVIKTTYESVRYY